MPDIKFSNQYPYTDFHELNLDWVIKEVKYWSTKVGKTIQSIELTGTVGLVDTYTINYSDGTTSTFDVTNGAGIASITKTGTVGLVDTYTITLQDGSTSTFEVTNGTAAIDPTLTLDDYAAEAKAVGDAMTTSQLGVIVDDSNKTPGYITGSGYIAAHANYYVVENVLVRKGQKIVIDGTYESGVMIMAEMSGTVYTADYRPVKGYQSGVTHYEFVPNSDMNMAITIPASSYTARIYTLVEDSSVASYSQVDVNRLINVFGDYVVMSENVFDYDHVLKGRVLGHAGRIAWGETDKTSLPIYCYGKTTVYVHSALAVGVQALCFAFYDNNMTYISQSSSWVTSASIPSNAYYLRVDFTLPVYTDYQPMITFSSTRPTVYIPFALSLEKFKTENDEYMHLFNDISIAGDSLASGEVYDLGGTPADKYSFSWLANICRTANATPHYYSQGGMTTKAWISSHWKTDLEAATPSNAYYIAFGTNDKNQTVYPIGNISDAAGTASFVGYYKQIIDIIHSHAPNAVIFCVSMYGIDNNKTDWSDMISAIADLYTYCYFIDFAGMTDSDLLINDSRQYTNFIENWHYTGLGYIRVGTIIRGLTVKTIVDNIADFKFFTADQS